MIDLRLAAHIKTRERIARLDVVSAARKKRAAALILSEHGFLRVRSTGYDLGKNPDPDNLLPTIFAGK